MRFPEGKPLPEAIALRVALARIGIQLIIVELHGAVDITKEVFEGIEKSAAFVAFGTKDYAEDTGNPA